MKEIDFLGAHNDKQDVGVLALGYFDCIHIGHKAVIREAKEIAGSYGEPTSVFLFRNDISNFIGKNKKPLYSYRERVDLLESLGVDCVVYVDADKAFMSLSASEFLHTLSEKLNVFGICCGKDFTFGRGGEGTPEMLANAFKEGQNCVVDLLKIGGEKVSSAKIKSALAEGDVALANKMLGRNFSVSGTVLCGRQVGRQIGFPTANIAADLPLAYGVYHTTAVVDGVCYKSITNVGEHPTFSDYSKNVETHILDFDGDLYGKNITVEFLRFNRPTECFDAVSELKATLKNDEEQRRNYD